MDLYQMSGFNASMLVQEPDQSALPFTYRSSSATSNLSEPPENRVPGHRMDALCDELTNLVDSAENIEEQFDAVVRQRLQSRDGTYSNFFPAMKELGALVLADESAMDAPNTLPTSSVGGHCSELCFYHSLAELKHKLQWVRDDFKNAMTQASTSVVHCS